MHYYSFSDYLKKRFGEKVRRISLNAGFLCPHNRSESSRDGCIFCNEFGFSDSAGTEKALTQQIEEGIKRSRERYGTNKFIAYFQNATGTNAPVAELKKAYDSIKAFPEIAALFISTRPDCVDEQKLELIAEYTRDYEVWIEYGVQTIHDRSLGFLNRGHTFSDAVRAINTAVEKGIKTGAHLVLGIPGENTEDMIATAREISRLPVSGVKLHVLHVLKDTELEKMYNKGEIELLKRSDYIEAVCDFLENIDPECVVLRLVSDAKKEYLIAPLWINDKINTINQIEEEFKKRGTSQGSGIE